MVVKNNRLATLNDWQMKICDKYKWLSRAYGWHMQIKNYIIQNFLIEVLNNVVPNLG